MKPKIGDLVYLTYGKDHSKPREYLIEINKIGGVSGCRDNYILDGKVIWCKDKKRIGKDARGVGKSEGFWSYFTIHIIKDEDDEILEKIMVEEI